MAGIEQLTSADISGPGLIDLGPLQTIIQIGNQVTSKIAQNIASYFPAMGALNTRLGITSTVTSTATLVVTGAGNLIAISVTNASSNSTTGMIYDAATTAASSSQAMLVIPSCAGYYSYPFPFVSGLVVKPSTAGDAHTVAVSYR